MKPDTRKQTNKHTNKRVVFQCSLRAKHFDSLHLTVIWQNQSNSWLPKFIFRRL